MEAHAKNALASSTAEVAGPGAAGVLIKIAGAPLALIADAVLLIVSAAILRGLRVQEHVEPVRHPFWPAMRDGLNFVRGNRLLVTMAIAVGVWQMCHHAALVVQILFATARARTVRARGRPQLRGARRRHDRRQHRRPSACAPHRARAGARGGLRAYAASAG